MTPIILDKPYLDLDQQITKIEEKNVEVSDEERGKTLLDGYSYFFLVNNGLKESLLRSDEAPFDFIDDVDLEDLARLHQFDIDLSSVLMNYIQYVEDSFKMKLADLLEKEWGATPKDYLSLEHYLPEELVDKDPNSYNRKERGKVKWIRELLEKVDYLIQQGTSDTPYLNFLRGKKRNVPPWALVHEIDFGRAEQLFKNIGNDLQLKLQERFLTLDRGKRESAQLTKEILDLLRDYRNSVAHRRKKLIYKSHTVPIERIYGILPKNTDLSDKRPNVFKPEEEKLFILLIVILASLEDDEIRLDYVRDLESVFSPYLRIEYDEEADQFNIIPLPIIGEHTVFEILNLPDNIITKLYRGSEQIKHYHKDHSYHALSEELVKTLQTSGVRMAKGNEDHLAQVYTYHPLGLIRQRKRLQKFKQAHWMDKNTLRFCSDPNRLASFRRAENRFFSLLLKYLLYVERVIKNQIAKLLSEEFGQNALDPYDDGREEGGNYLFRQYFEDPFDTYHLKRLYREVGNKRREMARNGNYLPLQAKDKLTDYYVKRHNHLPAWIFLTDISLRNTLLLLELLKQDDQIKVIDRLFKSEQNLGNREKLQFASKAFNFLTTYRSLFCHHKYELEREPVFDDEEFETLKKILKDYNLPTDKKNYREKYLGLILVYLSLIQDDHMKCTMILELKELLNELRDYFPVEEIGLTPEIYFGLPEDFISKLEREFIDSYNEESEILPKVQKRSRFVFNEKTISDIIAKQFEKDQIIPDLIEGNRASGNIKMRVHHDSKNK